MRNIIFYIHTALNLCSAVFAILAAFFWYRSAAYQARPEQARRDGPEIMVGMKIPLIATLDGQMRFSKCAALMAAIAAVLQALALVVGAT